MKIIVALDIVDSEKLHHILQDLKGCDVWVKVGMELFYHHGPDILLKVNDLGFKTFLDLKLHDIPSTVAKGLKAFKNLPINMINVHAAGGFEMMKQANEVVKEYLPQTLLIAVTQLTSTSEIQMQKEQNIKSSLLESVLNYAKLAHSAGLDGVVCSPFEVKSIKENIDRSFLTITPGIRIESSPSDDQKRFCTPEQALKFGSDFIVIGRPITMSSHAGASLKEIFQRLQT